MTDNSNTLEVTHTNRQKILYSESLNSTYTLREFAIGYCTKGYLRMSINGQTYDYRKGDVLFLLAGSEICIHHIADDYYGLYMLVGRDMAYSISKYENTIYHQYLSANPICSLQPDEGQLLLKYFETLMVYLNSTPDKKPDNFALRLLSDSLQIKVASFFIDHAQPSSLDTALTDGSALLFQQFIALIETHYKQRREISFYAEQLNKSSQQLSRQIKDISQETAKYWINQVTLRSIKELLIETELPISEIAQQFSFSSLPGFTQFFKNLEGTNPTAYRLQHKQP